MSQTNEIVLGEKSARRLAALLHASKGAEMIATAATNAHAAVKQQYEDAVGGVLEAHGVEVGGSVHHDADRGVLTITPESMAPT